MRLHNGLSPIAMYPMIVNCHFMWHNATGIFWTPSDLFLLIYKKKSLHVCISVSSVPEFLLWRVKISNRDVTAGATGATAVAPKFSDALTLFQPGGADSAQHRRGSTKIFPVVTSLYYIYSHNKLKRVLTNIIRLVVIFVIVKTSGTEATFNSNWTCSDEGLINLVIIFLRIKHFFAWMIVFFQTIATHYIVFWMNFWQTACITL